jgi:hypothetical protein
LTDEGQLTIASVTSPQPGLVVYALQEGELGEVLGYTAVTPGRNTNLTLTIDPLQATPSLAAILHVDAGSPGEFEYPDGPDVPLEFESGVIAQNFTPEFQLSLPVINVADQEILEDGLVQVESVVALEPGWLVIHADDDGELGAYLGSTPLVAGRQENLSIHIPWQRGSTNLHAVIYEDNGRPQQLDLPGDDTPFLANGEPVIASFTATYPPDLFVLDQPVVDGKFVVERVTSPGPGWLVVYYDAGGPGLIIGSIELEAGVNEQVVVEVLPSAVTSRLHLRVHEDTVPGDEFDFPRVDSPILYQGRQIFPYSFSTEPGNYLITRDQEPITGTAEMLQVVVPYAVVESPMWLVIQADNNGQPGEILDTAALQLGLNREVIVEIPAAQATERLHAALYNDAGELGQFEYPNGADTPLQRNRRLLSSSFRLLGE